MKRRKTEFEKALIEKGWELDYKSYYGKHQDKVLAYTYRKLFVHKVEFAGETLESTFEAQLVLEPKRENFIDVAIRNKMPEFVNNVCLIINEKTLLEVEKEVKSCLLEVNKWEEENSPEETIEVVEAIEENE